jgi:hypothetical protein
LRDAPVVAFHVTIGAFSQTRRKPPALPFRNRRFLSVRKRHRCCGRNPEHHQKHRHSVKVQHRVLILGPTRIELTSSLHQIFRTHPIEVLHDENKSAALPHALLSQVGFNRMGQKDAGAERCNKCAHQFKHWKSPASPPLGSSTGPAFLDGFVASGKWFRCTIFRALTTPPLACERPKDWPSHWLGATAQSREETPRRKPRDDLVTRLGHLLHAFYGPGGGVVRSACYRICYPTAWDRIKRGVTTTFRPALQV